jgi:hypothetical protein
MEVLRLTEDASIQSSSLARKLQVKIMQSIGIFEIYHVKASNGEISDRLEEVIDYILSALSDRVSSPSIGLIGKGYDR